MQEWRKDNSLDVSPSDLISSSRVGKRKKVYFNRLLSEELGFLFCPYDPSLLHGSLTCILDSKITIPDSV